MKIYLIKHKGKTWLGNFIGLNGVLEFSDKTKAYRGDYFFTLKDAKKMLKTLTCPEYFEVTSAEVKKSKQDNRFNF